MIGTDICYKAHVFHPELIGRIMNHVSLTSALLLKIAGHDGSAKALAGSPPEAWSLLPEWIVEALGHLVAAAAMFTNDGLHCTGVDLAQCLAAMAIFFESKTYVPKIHVRMGLCDAFF